VIDSRPSLRHEFVGMMFAVAVGAVGLQAAGLVRSGPWMGNLPAYSHLLLATIVIATSWVGWSRSVAPGARKDVKGIFEWEFVVLLLDVALVVLYFILVGTIDFSENTHRRVDPESSVSQWLLWIFVLYLAWDMVTKIAIRDETWPKVFSRVAPTVICVVVLTLLWVHFSRANVVPQITADLALLFVVLGFRAVKGQANQVRWALVCLGGFILACLLTK